MGYLRLCYHYQGCSAYTTHYHVDGSTPHFTSSVDVWAAVPSDACYVVARTSLAWDLLSAFWRTLSHMSCLRLPVRDCHRSVGELLLGALLDAYPYIHMHIHRSVHTEVLHVSAYWTAAIHPTQTPLCPE